ncbi:MULTISPECIES: hypothetical protein [Pseudomonas]|jgi:hypothetical protein|uniref:hypothetical protein n=1 Tax=Pseudomonas TaxID=286 RepID=UPI0005BD4E37|nr:MULTISPECIES: hypothetical protein [Pseudomonas]KWR84167.1 hypothetical protein RN02_06690 [Pseudomonas sp. PI1]WAB94773.1 hypothetical protein OSS47_12535 [Pseudomonas citronellolis]
MNTRTLAAGLVLALLPMAGSAWAFCSDQQALAKGRQVADKVATITKRDPETAKRLNAQLAAMKKSRSSKERPDDCAAYDQMLKELDQSAAKAKPAP